ncbi:hypothetical protein [Mycobacterium camsae]|uniref:hypothetical protein n=1 Tax=Mycobacterium gordonae TaxID=1778 RepID=UPI00197E0C54|nr:hypothetical protein [Mycobacterium gordonae]
MGRGTLSGMKIAAMVIAVLAAGALATASPAHADAMGDVQELQRQTSELHAGWDSLSMDQRSQQLARLQRQATIVQREVDDLPPEQRPEVQARLTQVTFELTDILHKVWPTP